MVKRTNKKIHKYIGLSGLVLMTLTFGGQMVLATDKDSSGGLVGNNEVVEVNSGHRLERRDQTFILGRLRLDKNSRYEFRERPPVNGIVEEVMDEDKLENPLGEEYVGYVEVKGRIKSGDKVWLEVSLDGKPAGYITQGGLEVKPITRSVNVGLPEGLKTEQVTSKEVTLYENLTFLDTKTEKLPEKSEITILGVYDVSFYTNPVESVKVETSEGSAGWVNPVDISGEVVTEDSTDSLDEVGSVTLRKGSVLYSKPTYLEESEVSKILEEDASASVVSSVEDTEVKGTYYKVYTKDGKEGYIKVNELAQEVPREVLSTDNASKEFRLKEPKVLVSKPNGVDGSRDVGILGVDAVLTSVDKVTTKDSSGKEDVFYSLKSEDSGFVGYAHESALKDSNDKAQDSEDSDKESEKLDLSNFDLDSLVSDKEEVDINDLQGWSIAESPITDSVNLYDDYIVPSTGGSSATVEFIQVLTPYTNIVKEGGLYPSVMMAQAILESSSGQSGLARNSLNLFGIKGSYNGQSTIYHTQEASGTNFYGVRAGFRDYPTLEAGIQDYVRLLNNQNYSSHGVVDAPSAFDSLMALKEAGYATDPLYVPKVWNVIDAYDLTQFD